MKRARPTASTPVVTETLRGEYESGHTMEDIGFLVWNSSSSDLKRNRTSKEGSMLPLVVETRWRCGVGF